MTDDKMFGGAGDERKDQGRVEDRLRETRKER